MCCVRPIASIASAVVSPNAVLRCGTNGQGRSWHGVATSHSAASFIAALASWLRPLEPQTGRSTHSEFPAERPVNRVPGFSPDFSGSSFFVLPILAGERGAGVPVIPLFSKGLLVLPERFELSTSPLPRECSTPELRQQQPGFLSISAHLASGTHADICGFL